MLFCGPRGVGKTTTARIIAKAFNCEGNNNKNPTFDICNNCKSCISITNGNCLDVLEVELSLIVMFFLFSPKEYGNGNSQ